MSKYSQDVVKMLYEHQSEYISGQYIANQLNISRTAVKKVIDQLKADGCDIDSINHKGHKLNASPNRWYRGIINKALESNHLVSKIEVYDSVESTQTIAKQSLVDNQYTMLILSDEQTKGRGRFNRNWSSSKGKGLWMSVVLRPNVSFAMIPKFNLFIALGIRDAIQAFSKDKVEIKWPNDIYINDKKVCGFLTEMVANADAVEAIICGIGINLNHQEEDFSDMIRHRATSIRLHYSEEINRYQFLKRLIEEIEKRYHQFLNSSFETIRDEYIRTSNIWHRKLTFTESGEQFIGEAIDIDNDGFLIVKDEDNQMRRLISADIDI
ncbi:biotin--[acetyl-CoA-carboxylase] ligase [Staphylococcus hominis]|uniref:biotin--[acetyl-CoA-carboxylase] ligase n=1 Tax=Staphylococcus hominis TaxID=1290 RepID=UPI0018886010|nr:biotin--[acetyl-CoA-carboxylase] ligase [Staphylococcus hominis]MBF2307924.1 biotin--[acetyl-CoA-carboxylase] ligase [Staphylococcus hominis]MBF2316934.1 biotin--[acetyl-CoA-carboxylase] ligase [Staphylococcus hominis]MBF2321221.1 biotin--[acetyl-CoA-carboxylase] ligase [Staphylococcus hominis]